MNFLEELDDTNPYLKEFMNIEGYKYMTNFISSLKNGENVTDITDIRFQLIGKYAFAVPCKEALAKIKLYEPIIEIGAGNGYWAFLLKNIGTDIIPVDDKGIKKKNWSHIFEDDTEYTEVTDGNENKILEYPERNLMLCWPPYSDLMAFRCLSLFEGDFVLYIGELGGCTANDDFHYKLDRDFVLVEHVNIPQWEHVNDGLFIYKRK